ncbi:hypothetical protein [Paenibacillus sp. Cedars]|uniref:hypothetical protein n=1 Tax=Paenibacillus sp. Cedars TaxID=1980674 RepID=UPI00116237FB|nr:hypothetical protein [Paenibacillus sp. Cedars]AWP30369.1 hypothetical protein B9D94_28865 [Paenibacillus sp. Cedars]
MWDRTGNIFPAAVVRPLSELYVVRGQRAPKGVFQDIFPYLSIHPRTFRPCCRSKDGRRLNRGGHLALCGGGEDVGQSGNLLPFTLRWLLRSGGCVAAAGVVK